MQGDRITIAPGKKAGLAFRNGADALAGGLAIFPPSGDQGGWIRPDRRRGRHGGSNGRRRWGVHCRYQKEAWATRSPETRRGSSRKKINPLPSSRSVRTKPENHHRPGDPLWARIRAGFRSWKAKRWTHFLKDRKVKDTALIKEMGRAFDLDARAATAGIYPAGRQTLITDQEEYTPMYGGFVDTVIATLALSSKNEALGDFRRPFSRADKHKHGQHPELSFEARFFFCLHRLLTGTGAAEYARSPTAHDFPSTGAGTVGLERGPS